MKKHFWQPYAAAIILVLTVLVSVAAAYAGYQLEETKNLSLGYYSDRDIFLAKPDPASVRASKTEVLAPGEAPSQWAVLSNPSTGYFLPADNWTLSSVNGQKTYTLDFVLANATSNVSFCKSDKIVRFELFATEGAGSANAFSVKLSSRGAEFSAAAEPAAKDSLLHYQYGDGFLYRFYNKAGQEMTWNLPGGAPYAIDMTLTVSGTVLQQTGFYLMAVADEGDFREIVMPSKAGSAGD